MKNISVDFFESRKPYLVILFIGLIVYFRSLFFGFTYFDDNVLILENLFFLKNLGNFFRSFTVEVFHVLHASAAYYRPLLTISYMFDAQFSGENPFFYHFSSVAIHLLNSCLVYLLLTRLKIKKELSLFLALVFVIHPVLAQAVSWLPGRNDSLLALFLLPAFIFFLDYFENKNGKSLGLHLLFFAFSLFTKESSLFVPLLFSFYILLTDYKKEFFRKVPLFLTGWFLIIIIWVYLRSLALAGNSVPYTFSSSVQAVLHNFPATLLYLGKIFLPFNLSVLPTLQDSTLIYGYFSLFFLLLIILLVRNKNWNLILFGIFWYLVFLLPSFIRPGNAYVADFLEHRIYVPLIGVFLVIGGVLSAKKIDFFKPKYLFLMASILTFLLVLNFIHNGKFSNKIVFWQDAVENSPHHPLAHKNLGAMYYLDNKYDQAEVEFLKSIELNPTEEMIHNNLGLIYLYRKDYQKAEEFFKKELELYPTYDNALANLGLMYYLTNHKKEAEQMWLKTIAVNPDHKDAYKSLAIYYQEIKDQAKSAYYYQEAIKRGVKF